MIEPGQTTLELLLENQLLYIVLLLAAATIGGLLAGKKESDDAKSGIGDKTRENISLIDWLEDAGYGLIGGTIGLAVIQMGIVPSTYDLLLPAFGFAGRKLLITWSQKAEETTPKTP